jgi:hypothetical protein
VDVSTCGEVAGTLAYTLVDGVHGIGPGTQATGGTPTIKQVLPPYSITILDVRFAAAMGGSLAR